MEKIANLFTNFLGLDLESKFGIRFAFVLSLVFCLCLILEWICIVKILKKLKKEVKDEKNSLGQQTLFTFTAFLHSFLTPKVLGILLFVLSCLLAFSTLFLLGTILYAKKKAGYMLLSKHQKKQTAKSPILQPILEQPKKESAQVLPIEEKPIEKEEEEAKPIVEEKPIEQPQIISSEETQIEEISSQEEKKNEKEDDYTIEIPYYEDVIAQEEKEVEEDTRNFSDEDLESDAFEEGEAPTPWTAPGDVIKGFNDTTGNYIVASYRYTLEAKIALSGNAIQNVYASIKNILLSYENVESFMTSTMEEFSVNSVVLARIFYRSGNLEIMFAISPRSLKGTNYKGVDCTHKSKFSDTPFLYKLSTVRKVGYAYELCQMVCENHKLKQTDRKPIEYYIMFPPRSKEDLIKEGLITEYIHEERPTVTFEFDFENDNEKQDEFEFAETEETPLTSPLTNEQKPLEENLEETQKESLEAREERIQKKIDENIDKYIPDYVIVDKTGEEPKQIEIYTDRIEVINPEEPTHITTKKEATPEQREEIEALKNKPVLTADDLSRLFAAAAENIDNFDDAEEEKEQETPKQVVKEEPKQVAVEQPKQVEIPIPQPQTIVVPPKKEEPKEDDKPHFKTYGPAPCRPSFYRNRNYYATEEEKNLPPTAEATKIEKIVYKDQNGNVLKPEDVKKGMFVIGENGAYIPAEEYAKKRNSGLNIPEEPKKEEIPQKPLKGMIVEEGTVVSIDIGRLQTMFQDGDIISLATLKQKDAISVRIDTLKVWCSEPLSKQFIVEAHKFSLEAIIQIESANGSAKKIG